ncbi:MAG: ATP-binding domain-containing protein [Merdibacter sp.]
MNPADDHKRELRVGSRIFREGDKVLQLKNMREDAVYNGDIGEIIEIVSEDENALSAAEIVVSFDDQIVEYAQDTLYYLTHAYCISIHKSQGNEYPIVILPVISEQRFMLNRRLLYTAVTRAKSALVVMGDRELFTASIQKEEQRLRNTSLVQHLQFYFSDCDDIPLPDFQPLAMSDE